MTWFNSPLAKQLDWQYLIAHKHSSTPLSTATRNNFTYFYFLRQIEIDDTPALAFFLGTPFPLPPFPSFCIKDGATVFIIILGDYVDNHYLHQHHQIAR